MKTNTQLLAPAVFAAAVLICGCRGDAEVFGSMSDVGNVPDAGLSDTGSGGTTSTPDAATANDASTVVDTGSSADASSSGDAASSTDMGSAPPDMMSMPNPMCGSNAKVGDYCGGDEVDNADPDTLYTCNGPGQPTAVMMCDHGCHVAPAGTADYCKPDYRLPWTNGVTMQLTQDCNDNCCNDHVGNDEYAWDFANATNFVVRAARGGTITHMKLSSTTGGGDSSYANYANMIVVDHGDGTQAIYMHLKGNTAQGGIHCGDHVAQGQALALAGTTGWSTGLHLHFQVSQVHPNAATCECGADGLGCAANFDPYTTTWVNSTYQTVPIQFEEWPTSSQCANRRMTMPDSLN